jgi:prepilin-type N-terminal cleavage/methylation domain-containing protein
MGRRGFTLIELVVVLAMLAIAAAVAVPALRPPAERSAGAAADSLRRVLIGARGDAGRRGVPVAVLVRASDATFVTMTLDAAGVADSLAAGSLPVPAGGRVTGSRGGLVRAVFEPTGRARADRVAFVDEGGRVEIGVDPWSGDARTAP